MMHPSPRSGRALRPAWPIALLLLLAACSNGTSSTAATLHPPGAESFASPAGGGPRTAGSGTGGPAAPGTTDGTSGASAARAVEEADVWQKVGATLYIANAWRGLVTVGVADPAAPALLARHPLDGAPVDLYVRGGVAFVITRGAMRWALDAPATGASILPMPWTGSRIVAVDVADPAHPVTITSLEVEGQVETTRLVGDVLYVVSRRIPWFDFGPMGGGVVVGAGGTVASGGGVAATGPALASADATSDLTYVASIDVSDPGAPRGGPPRLPGHRLGRPRARRTDQRIALAQSGWSPRRPHPLPARRHRRSRWRAHPRRPRRGRRARRRSLGARLRPAPASAPCCRTGWNGGATLRTWTSATVGEATPLGRLDIVIPETLTAARFDGARVYVVTAERVDPLWVVDAADPAQPVLAGQLHMPGQIEFIEPRGDRLLALGHTNEAGQPWQLAVSLVDVTDPALPTLLRRVLVGDGSGGCAPHPTTCARPSGCSTPAGLALVPYQGWDPASWSWSGGLQLVDFDLAAGTLAKRGFVPHPGSISRAFPVAGAGRLARRPLRRAAPDRRRDRPGRPGGAGHPRPGALGDRHRRHGRIAVELSGDWWRGDAELVVIPAPTPTRPRRWRG